MTDLAKLTQECVTAVLMEREALLRQREIISSIAFEVGHKWSQYNEDVRKALMEDLEGSRGLHDKFVEWSIEFDKFWEALPEGDPRRENYIIEIDDFTLDKLNGLIVMTRLEM